MAGETSLPNTNPPPPSEMSNVQFEDYFPLPPELSRTPTGSTVVEPDSVMDDSGRTFAGYKQGKYLLPNDAEEQDRLDFQHHIFLLLLDGKLGLAPLRETPKFVIDVGTGTGIWALEWAEQNPGSYVIGTDLSKIQPDRPDIPNCEFIKEDSEEEWIYPGIPHFDYIHLRAVATSFLNSKIVMEHAVRNLAPGGWIEYQDVNPTVYSMDGSVEGTAVQQAFDLFNAGMVAVGRDPTIATKYKEWLSEAGLVDIVETTFPVPCSAWPDDRKLKRIGQYQQSNLSDLVRSAGWQLYRKMGLSADEVERLVADFRIDIANTNIQPYFILHVVYGRKPYEAETQSGLYIQQ